MLFSLFPYSRKTASLFLRLQTSRCDTYGDLPQRYDDEKQPREQHRENKNRDQVFAHLLAKYFTSTPISSGSLQTFLITLSVSRIFPTLVCVFFPSNDDIALISWFSGVIGFFLSVFVLQIPLKIEVAVSLCHMIMIVVAIYNQFA